MALGFTSHFANNKEQPFGSLILSAVDSETAGSVASNGNIAGIDSLFSGCSYDSCDFSVSVNIDYSQYANYISTTGSSETAGSVALGGSSFSTANTVSSYSGGGGCAAVTCSCVSAATYTC